MLLTARACCTRWALAEQLGLRIEVRTESVAAISCGGEGWALSATLTAFKLGLARGGAGREKARTRQHGGLGVVAEGEGEKQG